MKFLLTNVGFFIVFCFVFSNLSSCTSTPDNQQVVVNENTAPANATPEKKKSDYPPPPSAIAEGDFKLIDGTTFKLEEKKGKVILINLWATWCGPCRGEMPHLIKLQDKYRDQGFEIIGLDVDPESKEDIENFAKDMKLNYQLGWSEKKLSNEFMKFSKMDGIPQSFLINRDGNLTGVFKGGGPDVISKLKETVEKIVNE